MCFFLAANVQTEDVLKGESRRGKQIASHTACIHVYDHISCKKLTHFGSPVVMLKDIGNIKAVEELKWFGEFEQHYLTLILTNILEPRSIFPK